MLIFEAVNKPFETRADNQLIWLLGFFGGGALTFLFALMFKPFSIRSYDAQTLIRQQKKWVQIVQVVKMLFVLNRPNLATMIIGSVNIMAFVVIAFNSSLDIAFNEWELLYWGANYRAYIDNGQYWRLLTSIFLHTGLIHLLFDLSGLLIAGAFAEPLIGKTKFVAVYIICGAIAALTSIGWNPEVIRVGSSGAIFGIYGVFLALLAIKATPKGWGGAFLVTTAFYVGFSLLLTINSVVDMMANLSGLLTGIICGFIIYPFLKEAKPVSEATAVLKKRDTDVSNL